MDVRNKVIVITGAGGGIGTATARRFADAGAIVVLTDVDDARGQQIATELGSPHSYVHLDVSDADAWKRVLADVAREIGGIDILHLNAGVMLRPRGAPELNDPIALLNKEAYRRVASVNMDGVMYGILAGLPFMEARGGGAIVIMSSGAGVRPHSLDPVYSMSKYSLVGLALSLGPALASRKVTVNALCPLGIDTPIIPADFKSVQGKYWPPASYIADCVMSIVESDETGAAWIAPSDRQPLVWRYDPTPSVLLPTSLGNSLRPQPADRFENAD